MDPKLENKVDLIAKNYLEVRKSARLDWCQAVCLGALLFTQSNAHADEARIRECRKMLQSTVRYGHNFRGLTSLALLCKMSMQDDPKAYLDDLLKAYRVLTKGKKFRSETLVFAAEVMAEGVDEDKYEELAKSAWETIGKMKCAHPFLTSQDDTAVATLLAMSDLDTDALLTQAEEIYDRMKDSGFKFNKGALQSISLILALSEKPLEEKCQRFTDLRAALKKSGHRIGGSEMVVLAAFVDLDVPIDTIVEQIADVDDALKHKKGFGSFLGCGAQMRRVFAAALVLQAYEEDKYTNTMSQMNALTSIIVEQVITLIILIAVVSAASAASSSH